jgi:hypothetical protein
VGVGATCGTAVRAAGTGVFATGGVTGLDISPDESSASTLVLDTRSSAMSPERASVTGWAGILGVFVSITTRSPRLPSSGVTVGGTGVAVGGIGVAVGGIGVAVGGRRPLEPSSVGVAMGGTGVAVGRTDVAVGGTGVAVGGTGVGVGVVS